MKDCPNCKSQDSMYERWNDHKCIECDHVYSPRLIGHTVPTRPADAECGEVLGVASDGVSDPCVRERMCNDDSHCTITVSGVKETNDGVYVAVCGIHNE